jgi:hypothetical protein
MNYECKTIPGYEDYEVDTNGGVYSLKFGKRRKLKPAIKRDGYLAVGLSNNGKHKAFKVHRLVMLSFVCESKLQVNHIDGVKTNNNLSNLEYCTPLENMRHAIESGLMNRSKGENQPCSKLTEKDVMEIKTALLTLYNGINNDLARKYNVSNSTISEIKIGKKWKHVKLN